MGKHMFLVLTNPSEGQEKEFNEWYDNVHLDDVLKVPGFVAARRFKLSDTSEGEKPYQYMALYEIEAEDPNKALELLGERAQDMVISESLDQERVGAWIFTPITERRVSKQHNS